MKKFPTTEQQTAAMKEAVERIAALEVDAQTEAAFVVQEVLNDNKISRTLVDFDDPSLREDGCGNGYYFFLREGDFEEAFIYWQVLTTIEFDSDEPVDLCKAALEFIASKQSN